MTEPQSDQRSRTSIIQTVQTPLGFFALVVLVVEAILGVTAGVVRGVNPTPVVTAMIVLIFLLVFIVAGFAFIRPEALQGRRAEILPPAAPVLGLESVAHIKRPSILFVSSTEYNTNGADEDTEVLQQYFPKSVTVMRGVSLAKFREIAASGRYSILHLLCSVDAQTGTLRFGSGEDLSAEGLERLTEISGAQLVVLATCDSVVLAAKIARVASMIASTAWVTTPDFVQWEQCFYNLIARGHPISKAYELARATTNAPMVLLLKRDLTFSP